MALTIQDVRDFVGDEKPEDNPLLMDLMWSDPDILSSMKAAARAYNSIEPQCEVVRAEALPDDDSTFLNGIAADLCRKYLNKLRNRDITYTAGNVQASVTSARIVHFEKMRVEYEEQFKQQAQNRKLRINLAAAYGHFS